MDGGSSDDRRRSRRRLLADLCGRGEPEEGEFVPGDHSDADTEEYYNNNRRGCSSDSEGTISDSFPANHGGASASSSPTAINNGGASSAAAAAVVLACPFCGKEFRNHKAVCGHMKVHREQGIGKKGKKGKVHQEQDKKDKKKKGIKRDVALVGEWGGTAKRGCSGTKGWAASPIAESGQSMAAAVAEAKMVVLAPMSLAFAPPNSPPVRMTPAKPNPPPVPTPSAAYNLSSVAVESDAMANDDSVESSSAMEAVAAGAASPPSEAVVHAAGEQTPPVHQQPVAPPPPPGGRQDPRGYTCNKCNKWFRTHQGLGGHVVGHKNRELAAALHGGAVPDTRTAKPAKAHVCKVCGAEFPGGIQLGGHMRKHYTGEPLNKKPRHVTPPGTATVGVAGLTVALSVKSDEASPAAKPAVVGRVLLFGIDIGTGVKTPAAQERSSATETSASTTTGGEQ
ncbi:hypothetical protein HU200_036765 [Digitaria exilis]|uniref:C2H2-type domain-containing protein n=1 Tax=Digitaria exilis TaxID=1010633 RepID=A0A835ELF6_9POAL|nr:hypothetical protein HU200_036765 [Digitaria exilis]CAB3477808.1 unnamed protein product [Digitaria exilis]